VRPYEARRMKTLVIGDIHNYTASVDRILKEVAYDKVIFLGDYFDNFNDTPADAAATAKWLKSNLYNPQFTFLWGNHDLPYAYPHYDCPGFSIEKQQQVNKFMDNQDWQKLQFLVGEQEYWLSHAGIDFNFYKANGLLELESVIGRLEYAETLLSHGNFPQLLCDKRLSVVWNRFDYLKVLPDVNQIVGHTPVRPASVRMKFTKSGRFNVCLDSYEHYGMIEKGEFQYFDRKTHSPQCQKYS
jgi:hypothetical protein